MSDIEDKIIKIESEIEAMVKAVTDENVWTTHYGAFDIDPKYLVIKICVESDDERGRLLRNNVLQSQLRYILEKHDYPIDARSRVYIGFESDETINRESGGNPRHHWQ